MQNPLQIPLIDAEDYRAVRYNPTVAVTDRGKISVITYEFLTDGDRFYFEYGVYDEQLDINEFESLEELKDECH